MPATPRKPIITTCCGCVQLKSGSAIIAAMAAAFGLWTAGSRLDSNPIVIFQICYGVVLTLGSFAGCAAIIKDYLFGIIAYAIFLCVTSLGAIGLRVYHLTRVFNKERQQDALDECTARGQFTPADCRNALNIQVSTLSGESFLVIVCAIYFTFVVVEFARDFKSNPEKYTNRDLFPSYTSEAPSNTFIVYTEGGRGTYPPQRPVDPYAQDLPVYQPPLPGYENNQKPGDAHGATPGAYVVPVVYSATATEAPRAPGAAVSRDTPNASSGLLRGRE
ncbi:hypothetical protein BC829DRAFT_406488 [Chytridium lagenaria]|nr:hypothetical protein BC829DRAFT_406488 [Chytridium lagenaria]